MFDSHCHLDAEEYDRDREAVLDRAWRAGVCGIVVPGYEPREWEDLARLCATDARLHCAVGIHPWYVHTLDADVRSGALAGLAETAQRTRSVAIGECGLDALRAKRGGADLTLQSQVLKAHLDVARTLELPVILHCVKAHAALLEILESGPALPRGGVLHSYSGPAELVPRYAKLGLYFGFAGVVTRPVAERPQRALAAVPSARLLVESDGPDQAAWGVEPRRSEPAHVALVLDAAARIRPEPRAELAQAVADNALRLFGLQRSAALTDSCPTS